MNLPVFLHYFPLGEDKQEVFGVPSKVHRPFSSSQLGEWGYPPESCFSTSLLS